MRLTRMLLITLLAILSFPLQAAEDVAIQRLTTLLNQAQTISGRFSQLTLDGSGTQLQETSGSMALKRPGQFRWHTDAPMEQLLISNGETIWLFDPDLEQVTIQKMDQRLTHTPALLLSGDISKIAESFAITLKEGGSVVDFILKPKATDSLFESLRLSFRGGVINDMQLIDNVGQRTNILFLGGRLNPPIEASQFTFEVPAGVDVIQD